MVELRKRPQRDPPAPAPATKKSRATKAKAVPTAAATEPAAESSAAAEPAPTGVVGKAKRAANKVKEAVTGSEAGTTESAPKQPSVEDAPPAAVETGEAGMIPETAGTAPSSATVPAESGSAATVPTATGAEVKKPRGKPKAAGVSETSTPAVAPAPVAAPEASTEAATSSGHAAAPPPPAAAAPAGKPIRGKAKAPTPVAGVTSPQPAPAVLPTTTETAAPPAAPAATATGVTSPTEENRPPATEDLENPPETGKVDTSASTCGPLTSEPASTPLSPSSVGKPIPPTLGGPAPLETHTGAKITFADLLTQSTSGIIIFTYPRASTPGCTQQACAFRDNHDNFAKDSGYSVYGLSTDSVKANNTFATKQNLQYPLLCDVTASLTGALGMKKAGNAKGTLRGVVVVDKSGVVKVWFQGGPGKTVDAVKEFLAATKK